MTKETECSDCSGGKGETLHDDTCPIVANWLACQYDPDGEKTHGKAQWLRCPTQAEIERWGGTEDEPVLVRYYPHPLRKGPVLTSARVSFGSAL